jgi:hypothetical protein
VLVLVLRKPLADFLNAKTTQIRAASGGPVEGDERRGGEKAAQELSRASTRKSRRRKIEARRAAG